MRVFLLMTTLLAYSLPTVAGSQPRTLVCNFDGDNSTKIYKVVTAPGVGTTFRLPEGWKITDFVVTDPKVFHAESNGSIGIVTPLAPDKNTSVSIYTDTDKLFVFFLSSKPEPSGYVDQLVVVECNNLQFFNQKVRNEARKLTKEELDAAETRCNARLEEKTRQLREQLLFSINNRYKINDPYFSISKVSDDGIFTYVRLGKSQNRPAVYVGESNNQKNLEPVKYTDEGEYYIVHRVLPPGENRFFLKLGNWVSEVKRAN